MANGDHGGKVCLLTGATTGIGRAAAEGLARTGLTLVLAGRDAARTEAAVEGVRRASGNDRVEGLVADLSLGSEVRRLAAEFRARHRRLDVLVNNAGAIFTRREETAEGREKTLALNHLAYFLLTRELLDLLLATAPARVVNVASEAHRGTRLDFDDLDSRRRYSGLGVYGRSKLMNLLFTAELARRLEGKAVTANALHPGVVATGFGGNTPGLFRTLVRIAQPFMLSPEKGARTLVYLATSPEVEGVSGKYFYRCREMRPSPAARDPESARRLWELSEQLVSASRTRAA
ncbi:MAG TPA: SDR family oxidoreductase [Myxococcaceae bacterium]|nr:SDR family oxidoreductase [Myxococcaceae bacterium]